MTEKYSFFGSAKGEIREYDQTDYAEVYKRFIKTGVFPSVENELAVAQTIPARLAVQVNTGQAYIEGYWYSNTSIKEIDLPVADAVNPRIDRIVLRLDVVNERKITAEYLKGTASVAPVAPSLTRTDQIYEISLAQIRVNAGATSILNANITDERNTLSLCGWAVPPITNQQVIDVTKLFGLGDVAKDISGTDLNFLDATGFYKGSNLGNNPNGVAAEIWTIYHVKHSSTGATQEAVSLTSTPNKKYTREKTGGTWSAWDQVAQKSNTPSFLNIDAHNDATILGETAYPTGITMQSVGAGTGFPHTHGMTVNLKQGTARFAQIFFRPGATAPDVGMWFRHYYTGVGWSPWEKVAVYDYAASMKKSSTVNIPAGGSAKIVFDEIFTDWKGMANTSNGRFTALSTGSYLINVVAPIYIEANKTAGITIYKNGAIHRVIGATDATNTAFQTVVGTEILRLNAGDYIEVYLYTSSSYNVTAKEVRANLSLM